jgi:hypothetical protein
MNTVGASLLDALSFARAQDHLRRHGAQDLPLNLQLEIRISFFTRLLSNVASQG